METMTWKPACKKAPVFVQRPDMHPTSSDRASLKIRTRYASNINIHPKFALLCSRGSSAPGSRVTNSTHHARRMTCLGQLSDQIRLRKGGYSCKKEYIANNVFTKRLPETCNKTRKLFWSSTLPILLIKVGCSHKAAGPTIG